MDSEMAAWLRQQREDRGWSKAEMARRLIRAGREAGDTAVPELSGMLHNIHRWEREGGISERHTLHYCRTLGIHPSQFGLSAGELAEATTQAPSAEAGPAALVPVQRPAAAPATAGPCPPAPAGIAYRGRQESVLRDFAVEHEVMMAAHEGSDHAAEHEHHGIGEQQGDGPGEVDQLAQSGVGQDGGGLAQVSENDAGGAGAGQQRVRVDVDDRVVVHVDHPGIRRGPPGDLVHVPGRRDAGADVDELPYPPPRRPGTVPPAGGTPGWPGRCRALQESRAGSA